MDSNLAYNKIYVSITFLMLILNYKPSQCLLASDFCIKKNSTCLDTHLYQCDTDICAKNIKHCQSYNSLAYLASCSVCRIIKSNLHVQEVRKAVRFLNNIKPCSLNRASFSPNDVCLNKIECYDSKYLLTRLMDSSSFLKKRTDCKCSGKFSYSCTRQFCTTDQTVCDKFNFKNKLNKRNQVFSFGIRECNDDMNKLYKLY